MIIKKRRHSTACTVVDRCGVRRLQKNSLVPVYLAISDHFDAAAICAVHETIPVICQIFTIMYPWKKECRWGGHKVVGGMGETPL